MAVKERELFGNGTWWVGGGGAGGGKLINMYNGLRLTDRASDSEQLITP